MADAAPERMEWIAADPASLRVLELAYKVAATATTVLITGESGTGKDLLARLIHERSPRRDAPFLKIDCASLPAELVESELFGHERGAFTGAVERKLGRLEMARGGAIVLDEVAALEPAVQSKLLRVLEERRFERVGGNLPIEVDVRIVTATNRDLRAAIAAKSFREDLYFRIAAVPITIPPLRERGNDVLLLADHFLEKFKREFRKPSLTLAADARARLAEYAWPGNVRELQNTMERAVILSDGASITAESLQLPAPRPAADAVPANLVPDNFNWDGPLEEVSARAIAHVERLKIEAALRAARWNKTRAAEALAISPKALLAKMRALGLE